MLSDLRESGSIEQDADVVMFIYRDEYYNRESERLGEADVIVAKHRNGPIGEVALTFLPKYPKFANLWRDHGGDVPAPPGATRARHPRGTWRFATMRIFRAAVRMAARTFARAAELLAQGRSQAEVARELDVSRQSASRWHAGWQASGATALQSRGPTGRRPKVADDQLEAIEQALLEGALAHGFATDVWTLERIAVVIQGLTGVGLSNPSVWRLLRGRLGWSVQRPQRQATRDAGAEGFLLWNADGVYTRAALASP
jgi:transposase